MRQSSFPFEIVVRASPRAEPVLVQPATDADRATAIFHAEAARLRAAGATGELVMVNCRRGRKAVLRQPLNAAVGDG